MKPTTTSHELLESMHHASAFVKRHLNDRVVDVEWMKAAHRHLDPVGILACGEAERPTRSNGAEYVQTSISLAVTRTLEETNTEVEVRQ
jgi:hypothetical protein